MCYYIIYILLFYMQLKRQISVPFILRDMQYRLSILCGIVLIDTDGEHINIRHPQCQHV